MTARHHSPQGHEIAARLLAWYDRARRDLPWRAAPGEAADPYRVWLSEIMLQQTTVKAVIPYFHAFLRRWPDVASLACAPEDDVLAAWAGLGYYARARNLMACAQTVVARHGGAFPRTESALLELPGVGPYTAAAIAAIAFGERASPVDGNIERITARLFAVRDPLPGAKRGLRRLAATLTPETRAGDFAQALMDLGTAICTPRRPLCAECPLAEQCLARASGIEASLPARAAKSEKPMRFGAAFVAIREDGFILLRRRPERGLLARMLEVPSTIWGAPEGLAAARAEAPVSANWRETLDKVRHVFTHFNLELTVLHASVPENAQLTGAADPGRCHWSPVRDLSQAALPSVMRKVIARALE